MWTHSSRRSHEHSRSESKQSRCSSPALDNVDGHRRTSSDATPRPTPATTRFLTSTTTDHDSSAKTNLTAPSDGFGPSKRLGFLADKLSSSLSGTGNTHVKNQSSQSLLHPSPGINSSSSAPMSNSASIVNAAKSHTSPSKVRRTNDSLARAFMYNPLQTSYGRTYDSKLVTREMHRLNLAHLPSALTAQPSTAPSVSSLSLPNPAGMSQVNIASTSTDPWSALHVHVLPLFNGEGLKLNM
jgi:hypothetical protein